VHEYGPSTIPDALSRTRNQGVHRGPLPPVCQIDESKLKVMGGKTSLMLRASTDTPPIDYVSWPDR
jgi:hypothetical protein